MLLVEATSALRRRPYHRQKLHLVLSALRHADRDLGDRATLLQSDTYTDALERYGRPVLVHEPTSHAAERFVHRLRKQGLVADVLPTPTFALPRKDFAEWAGDRTRFRMEDFYRDQRRRFDVLMDGDRTRRQPMELRRGQPRATAEEAERRWRFRSPTSRAKTTSTSRSATTSTGWTCDTWSATTARGCSPSHPPKPSGRSTASSSTGCRPSAATRTRSWATTGRCRIHCCRYRSTSVCCIRSTPSRPPRTPTGKNGAPLAAVEGFIRQILGWREYMWHLYWHFGPGYTRNNELHARTALPKWWRELDADAVTAECLRHALTGVRDRGWTHHIQRLMVLGSHALQRGYRPAELTEWFATAYVDGFRWVMPTNVVGMSQHADGGKLATKPYTSGGAYINKMSDHCGDCAYDPKKRLGDDACPFTAGYWSFVHRHRDLLAKNNRTQRSVASMDRLKDLDAVLEQESARRTF